MIRAIRIRLAWVALSFLLVGLYLAMGGRLSRGDEGTILVEYGADRGAFEGLELAIDGRPVGRLRGAGGSTFAGFSVKEGLHEVRVVARQFACRPRKVEVFGAHVVRLTLDYDGGSDGSSRPVLSFQ